MMQVEPPSSRQGQASHCQTRPLVPQSGVHRHANGQQRRVHRRRQPARQQAHHPHPRRRRRARAGSDQRAHQGRLSGPQAPRRQAWRPAPRRGGAWALGGGNGKERRGLAAWRSTRKWSAKPQPAQAFQGKISRGGAQPEPSFPIALPLPLRLATNMLDPSLLG